MVVHLVKLCVGAESVEDLASWQTRLRQRIGGVQHVTRQTPRRVADILDGGSIYWVIRGRILVRQRILDLAASKGADGVARCAIVLDPALQRTTPTPRKAFQGWRYLKACDAPPDAGTSTSSEPLPTALASLGLL